MWSVADTTFHGGALADVMGHGQVPIKIDLKPQNNSEI